jgi:hypothetical protein
MASMRLFTVHPGNVLASLLPADAHHLRTTSDTEHGAWSSLLTVIERAWEAQAGAPATAR